MNRKRSDHHRRPPASRPTDLLTSSPYYKDPDYPTFDPAGPRPWSTPTRPSTGPTSTCSPSRPRGDQVVQAVQQMWEQVGFSVTVSEVEQAEIIDDFVFGKFQAVTSYQFGASIRSHYVWWSTTLSRRSAASASTSPACDGARDGHARGASHHRPGCRVAAYQKVNDRLAKDCPTCGSSSTVLRGGHPRVQNFNNLVLPNGMKGYSFTKVSSSLTRPGWRPDRPSGTGPAIPHPMSSISSDAHPTGGGGVHHLVLIFLLVHLLPATQPPSSWAQRHRPQSGVLFKQLGLNKPLFQQY